MQNTSPSTIDITGGPNQYLDVEPPRSSHPRQFLELFIGASAVIGGLAYAILRLVLLKFYTPLGVTPEEVGWDGTAVLTRFAWPVLVLLLTAAYVLVGFLQDRLFREGGPTTFFSKNWKWLVPVVVIAMTTVLILFAQGRVNALRRGTPLAATLDSAVPVSAPCVYALWIDVQEPLRASLPAFDAAHRYFFLGQAGGTTVLYDATTDAALRVPTGRVVLKNCSL